MPNNSLKYPNKSHRKTIDIPCNSIKLAEFMGIHFGDGGINNPWQVVISLNSVSDLEYSKYICKLIASLFEIKVSIRKRPNQNTLVLVCSSTTLVEFLVSKGAVKGNKIAQQIDIPKWISSNPRYEKTFVRGLVDTDGCLYIHKHLIKGFLYRNIGLCFTSYSQPLTLSVANILKKNNIDLSITNGARRIYLYRTQSVLKYLNTFGSSNQRILQKYIDWRGV